MEEFDTAEEVLKFREGLLKKKKLLNERSNLLRKEHEIVNKLLIKSSENLQKVCAHKEHKQEMHCVEGGYLNVGFTEIKIKCAVCDKLFSERSYSTGYS